MMSQSMPFEKWQGHKEDEKLSLGQHQNFFAANLLISGIISVPRPEDLQNNNSKGQANEMLD
jgi:hypothetical protein